MGIAYDLTGDGKTRVHGYYGRFYDSGFLTLSSLLRRTSQGYSEVPWDPEAGAWDYDNPSFSVADQFLAHDDLRNPYSDEFDIGVAREVGPGLALGITGTYEESRRFWEDDEVNLIWNDEGTQIIGGRNGSNDAVYRLRTPDDTFTRYTSVELTLAKQYTDNWGLEGSYTWSRAYGTNSFDQASASADIAQQRQYEIGFLDYDRTHQVKAAGSYSERNVTRVGTTKLGYVFGWNYQLHSGEPMHPFYSDAAYDLYTGPADGRLRLPAYSKTDVRTGLTLDFDDRIFWMLGVDVFNLFNDRVPTGMYAELPTLDATDPVFTVTSIQQPRSMQLSIRAEF